METLKIGLLETQPLTAEGVRASLAGAPEFSYSWSVGSLTIGLQLLQQQPVDVLFVDKGLGMQGALRLLETAQAGGARVIVWGSAMSESEALQLLQAGARGILRRSADPGTLVACLRVVAEGSRWMEDCVFRDPAATERGSHSELTTREQQVLQLVQLGLKNREIASELGIRPGTVKIHLKHIFEKTGARGRYSLALDSLRAQPEEVNEALHATAGQ